MLEEQGSARALTLFLENLRSALTAPDSADQRDAALRATENLLKNSGVSDADDLIPMFSGARKDLAAVEVLRANIENAAPFYDTAIQINRDCDGATTDPLNPIGYQLRAMVSFAEALSMKVKPLQKLELSVSDVYRGLRSVLLTPRTRKLDSPYVGSKTTTAQSLLQRSAALIVEFIIIAGGITEDEAAELVAAGFRQAGAVPRPNAIHNGTSVTAAAVKKWKATFEPDLGEVRDNAKRWVEAHGTASREQISALIKNAVASFRREGFQDFLKM